MYVTDMVGTAGNDTLVGTPGTDVIAGLGGNDSIAGGDGDDIICGGAGDDFLSGCAGADKIYGDGGNDRIAGGDGDDSLYGGSGDDRVDGGSGTNVCDGGSGANQTGVCAAILAPGAGGTIIGPGGATAQVAPGALPYAATVQIAVVPNSVISAPLGQLPLLTVLQLTHHAPVPERQRAAGIGANHPLGTDHPSRWGQGRRRPAGTHGLALGGCHRGPARRHRHCHRTRWAADHLGERVPGIVDSGTFAFVRDTTGSGFATGIVTDSSGPRSGVVVSNNTNTLVSVTNGAGRYTVYINGGPYTVTGFDPLRGSSGSAGGNIVTSGSTVTTNIGLTALAAPPITRDEIRNGGFERRDLSSWALTGAGSARTQLACSGATVTPREGKYMADVHTGPGSIGATRSAIKQRFRVPAGVRTLTVDFNFVSEEFPEFVGSAFNDAFRAIVRTPNGESTFAQVSVNQSGGFSLIGDCNFPGG